jgi:hypothetical protein
MDHFKIERNQLRPFFIGKGGMFKKYNFMSNPGPTFLREGFSRKLTAFSCAHDMYEEIVGRAHRGELDKSFLKPRYGIAGRAKLTEWDKTFTRLSEGKAVGRAVWMADAHESLVANVFVSPLNEWNKRNLFKTPFSIGFNRFRDGKKFLEHLTPFGVHICGDYDEYDSTLSGDIILSAFMFIDELFVDFEGKEQLLRWLYEELVHSHLVLADGSQFRKSGGVPSGSGLTSWIDTICNAMMLWVALEYQGLTDYGLVTYGDDCVISLTVPAGENNKSFASKVRQKLCSGLKRRFRVSMTEAKSEIATRATVGARKPVGLDPWIGRTGKALRQLAAEMRATHGYVNWNDLWEDLDFVPDGPLSEFGCHRFHYRFAGAVNFLGFYLLPNGGMIRPTIQMEARILCPERPVKTIDEHLERLVCAYIENYDSWHCRNHLHHWLYDAWWMKENGIHSASQAWSDFVKTHKSNKGGLGPDVVSGAPHEIDPRWRFWYRKQLMTVDEMKHPQTEQFRERLLYPLQKICARVRKDDSLSVDKFYSMRKLSSCLFSQEGSVLDKVLTIYNGDWKRGMNDLLFPGPCANVVLEPTKRLRLVGEYISTRELGWRHMSAVW